MAAGATIATHGNLPGAGGSGGAGLDLPLGVPGHDPRRPVEPRHPASGYGRRVHQPVEPQHALTQDDVLARAERSPVDPTTVDQDAVQRAGVRDRHPVGHHEAGMPVRDLKIREPHVGTASTAQGPHPRRQIRDQTNRRARDGLEPYERRCACARRDEPCRPVGHCDGAARTHPGVRQRRVRAQERSTHPVRTDDLQRRRRRGRYGVGPDQGGRDVSHGRAASVPATTSSADVPRSTVRRVLTLPPPEARAAPGYTSTDGSAVDAAMSHDLLVAGAVDRVTCRSAVWQPLRRCCNKGADQQSGGNS